MTPPRGNDGNDGNTGNTASWVNRDPAGVLNQTQENLSSLSVSNDESQPPQYRVYIQPEGSQDVPVFWFGFSNDTVESFCLAVNNFTNKALPLPQRHQQQQQQQQCQPNANPLVPQQHMHQQQAQQPLQQQQHNLEELGIEQPNGELTGPSAAPTAAFGTE